MHPIVYPSMLQSIYNIISITWYFLISSLLYVKINKASTSYVVLSTCYRCRSLHLIKTPNRQSFVLSIYGFHNIRLSSTKHGGVVTSILRENTTTIHILPWFIHPWSFLGVTKSKGDNEGPSSKDHATVQQFKVLKIFFYSYSLDM